MSNCYSRSTPKQERTKHQLQELTMNSFQLRLPQEDSPLLRRAEREGTLPV